MQLDGWFFVWEWVATDWVSLKVDKGTSRRGGGQGGRRQIVFALSIICFDRIYMWRPSGKFNIYQLTITSTPIPGKTLKDAGFCFGDKEFVVYLENTTNNLYIRNLQLPKLDTTKKKLDDSQLFPTFQAPTLVSYTFSCL